MRSVSPCPYCGQPATIPLNIDAEAVVHCPLCQYEFELGHALLNATDAPPEHIAELPPELIPLVPPAAADASSQTVAAEPGQGAGAPQTATVGKELLSRPWGASSAAQSKQNVRNSIRNAVGLVLSGLLGLALAYGLLNWIGPPSLRFWSRQKPPAAEKDRSADPGPDGEFPGLDKDRFSEDHKGP